ncbi:Sec-independent protein translocase subunit TatA [Streptomyces sp. NPDC048161]|jgi:sec-independent protein translocase protein TatA|uniref:Sec-independent protein translocase subunit TatA n=1 Tax=unclassified Streptomyces TaxID=2593676 RepID=UPI00081B784E|nr:MULTISPECIES: Sec-independent protein translocase subunit TatA [unclassified Streptomyces]MEE1743941.1 Sec-independent protein translocase subunit TatA [Streptomyces sp. JV184]MYQ83414.1 twin-arginine translocase TatA/TatE family subunit [Streptomyces sp. SID4936]SCD65907.1 sec-independent protein translocase protein TatA [Streptomyces sp. DvalAA-43]
MLRNGLEPWHLLIVAIVVIVLFGSKKLPEAARSLGKSMRILKSEAKAMKQDGAAEPAAAPAPAEDAPVQETPRTIRAAPGDVASARSVAESDAAR